MDYFANCSISNEYRDAEREGVRCFQDIRDNELDKENARGKKERPMGRFESNSGKHMDKFKISRLRRFQGTDLKNVAISDSRKWQPKLALVGRGDYNQRRPGITH